MERENGECALVDVIAKQFWKKIRRSGPAHEEQSCPCLLGLTTCDLIDCFPLKTGDLIYSQQFSFLTIAWPPHSQASLCNQKGRAPMHPLHICPLGYPIGSLSTRRCILEPERSGLLALIERLKSWLNIHIPRIHLRWRNLKCMVRWILGLRPRLENRSVVRVRERQLTT